MKIAGGKTTVRWQDLVMATSFPLQDSFKPSPLYEIAVRVAQTRQITAAEQGVLRTLFLEKPLTEEEHRYINRLYRALRRGQIKLR